MLNYLFFIGFLMVFRKYLYEFVSFTIFCSKILFYYYLKINKQQHEKFNKKYIKISYKYNGNTYFYLLKIPRGITPLSSIKDENDIDITDTIMPYLGPNLDCHNIKIYPKDFGYNKIKVTTLFDKVVIFEENDPIILTD